MSATVNILRDGEIIRESAADFEAARAPGPDPVPTAVSMRQARLALSRAGLLANAESAIAGMTGEAGDEARIEWEYAAELRREHPLVTSLGQTLGLDDAAKDDLFRQAALIL